jgi:hypothetical protein
LGPTNPLTLQAAWQQNLALVRAGKPRAALTVLPETERRVIDELGPEHPLRYRRPPCSARTIRTY